MDDPQRQRRSDGERTHSAILDVAARIASIEGLEGLTIGRLASELDVSKSGVYAHFGSRAQLQLETIRAAQAVVDREVIEPAMAAEPGLTRLEELCERFLSYVERLVFPGGCFFASLLAEMDARTGPLHDMAQQGARDWWALMRHLAAEAQQRGELREDADLDQLVFMIDACLEAANYYYVLLRDPQIIERARRGVTTALDLMRT